MTKRKFLALRIIGLITICFFWGAEPGRAQSQQTNQQTQQYRNRESIIQRRMSHITPQQRQAAAARLAATRFKTDPNARNRRGAARAAANRAAEARIAAVRSTTPYTKEARIAAVRTEAARETAARAATTRKTGGINE